MAVTISFLYDSLNSHLMKITWRTAPGLETDISIWIFEYGSQSDIQI
jgi:hypothetical protein